MRWTDVPGLKPCPDARRDAPGRTAACPMDTFAAVLRVLALTHRTSTPCTLTRCPGWRTIRTFVRAIFRVVQMTRCLPIRFDMPGCRMTVLAEAALRADARATAVKAPFTPRTLAAITAAMAAGMALFMGTRT